MAGQSSKGVLGFFKGVFKNFSEDSCPRLAASIAYYTAFAMPPLLVFILLILGLVVDPQQIEGAIAEQIQEQLGPQGAEQVQTMIRNAQDRTTGGTMTVVLGIAALVFSASGAFLSLQGALNVAWKVRPDPEGGGVKTFLFKRLASLGMVLVVAFLLLVSLIVSGVVSAVGGALADFLPQGFSSILILSINWAVSLGLFTLLFAAIFKVLPDATVDWHDVWVGALFTAFLFVVGQVLIGIYFQRSNPGSAFGAAGSLAVILLWIYISSLILLFGAEFTQNWARRRGKRVRPEEGAVRYRIQLVREEAGHPPGGGKR